MTGRDDSRGPSLVTTLLAWGLGALLVRSAILHTGNNFAFLATVYSYDILDESTGVAVAAYLPYCQLTIGLALLLFHNLRSAAFWWASMLFLLFASVQLATYARGLNIACGCFAPSDDDPIGPWSIGMAISAGACALVGAIGSGKTRGVAAARSYLGSSA